jgi:hypothetical protein
MTYKGDPGSENRRLLRIHTYRKPHKVGQHEGDGNSYDKPVAAGGGAKDRQDGHNDCSFEVLRRR